MSSYNVSNAINSVIGNSGVVNINDGLLSPNNNTKECVEQIDNPIDSFSISCGLQVDIEKNNYGHIILDLSKNDKHCEIQYNLEGKKLVLSTPANNNIGKEFRFTGNYTNFNSVSSYQSISGGISTSVINGVSYVSIPSIKNTVIKVENIDVTQLIRDYLEGENYRHKKKAKKEEKSIVTKLILTNASFQNLQCGGASKVNITDISVLDVKQCIIRNSGASKIKLPFGSKYNGDIIDIQCSGASTVSGCSVNTLIATCSGTSNIDNFLIRKNCNLDATGASHISVTKQTDNINVSKSTSGASTIQINKTFL